jgi:hypothetical protein
MNMMSDFKVGIFRVASPPKDLEATSTSPQECYIALVNLNTSGSKTWQSSTTLFGLQKALERIQQIVDWEAAEDALSIGNSYKVS